jgi:hypothetical protein
VIIFFDRDVGITLPQALRIVHFDRDFAQIHYHQQHFAQSTPDDQWMPIVGANDWTLIGHDSRHHEEPAELAAIKQYSMGCFYLWGSEAKRWEKLQCFARVWERIVAVEASTPRPFIFRVTKMGLLRSVPIP